MNVINIDKRQTVQFVQPPTIVAASTQMSQVLKLVRRVARSEVTTVLLQGETGVGKDMMATLLHEGSPRAAHRFVAVNCAAIPEMLLESELFGHERGAFTDARCKKPGLLEVSQGGSIFLDEISQIPARLQAKLLRVMEARCFRRVGGIEDLETDCRFIAATNEDLQAAVRLGRFRMDLFYRLNVIQIRVPPLRERREDILPLAEFFIDFFNRKLHCELEGVAAEAREALLRYDWPGNVRELRNTIESAMVLEDSSEIQIGSLPTPIGLCEGTPEPAADLSLPRQERRLILRALERSGGNQAAAAAALEISRDALRYRMKKHGLQRIRVQRQGRCAGRCSKNDS